MTSFTAQELISKYEDFRASDSKHMAQRPSGVVRSAWRAGNPDLKESSFKVLDGAFKTKPVRALSFYPELPFQAVVWEQGQRSRMIETIDLRAPNANEKLSRYIKA